MPVRSRQPYAWIVSALGFVYLALGTFGCADNEESGQAKSLCDQFYDKGIACESIVDDETVYWYESERDVCEFHTTPTVERSEDCAEAYKVFWRCIVNSSCDEMYDFGTCSDERVDAEDVCGER